MEIVNKSYSVILFISAVMEMIDFFKLQSYMERSLNISRLRSSLMNCLLDVMLHLVVSLSTPQHNMTMAPNVYPSININLIFSLPLCEIHLFYFKQNVIKISSKLRPAILFILLRCDIVEFLWRPTLSRIIIKLIFFKFEVLVLNT